MSALQEISAKWPTIFELAASIPQVDLTGQHPRGGRNRPPVTQGLTPEKFPAEAGLHEVTPAQLCSLRVPKIEVNGDIRGFQREKVNRHARKIAKAMLAGDEMPPIIVSIFKDGLAYVDDGQHRALGAVIARKNLEVVVKQRTIAQARKLFANQAKARNLRSDDTILTGDSALEIYIQDAVTCDDHPWSDLVATYHNSPTKMTPTSMATIVGSFTFNTMNAGVQFLCNKPAEEFDPKEADKLAAMIRAFGTKRTNPLAFRARSLRAITYAAVHIFRRSHTLKPEDYDRWRRHMPTFDFSKFGHLLLRENDLALELIAHWNKRLPEERKVKPTYR